MAIQAQFPSCGASLDWMDNGCGGFNQSFYLNVQQQKQPLQQQQQQCNMQQLQNQQQQRSQNFCFDDSLLVSYNAAKSSNSNHPSMSYSQIVAAHDVKQKQEIDHYIRVQNERLRLVLQEQSKQQRALLLKRIESRVLPLLRQKDHELAQAAKRKLELEDFLKRLEMENQAWQKLAQENEATAMSLNNTIEQLREKAPAYFNSGADDAESCCDMNREEQDKETEQINRGFVDDNVKEQEEKARKTTATMVCKGCNSRNSCILFLPCRHLCSCKACETFLAFCPVCQAAKKASIEALMV